MSARGTLAGLVGLTALCLFTLRAGEGKPETEEAERTGPVTALLEGIEESLAEEDSRTKEAETELLRIQTVDDWPAESELETRVLEEERRDLRESDSVFVEMTNLIDTGPDTVWLLQQDESVKQQEGIAIQLNTAQFFVPDGGSRCFGVPNFSTELFGEGERETRQSLDEENLIGDDCADFNDGIDATRRLVASGYLNGEITRLLDRFPQIDPHGREYTLRLVNAGTTLRQEDQTSWWDVDYAMYTQADNGEELMLVYIDITRVILSNGEVWDWDDAHYRIDVAVENLWQLMEDPAEDRGEVWLQQIRGDSLADEESIRQFVSEQGTKIVLPQGVDDPITWDCSRQKLFYYDWLVFQGETADYTVALAVPLMEKREEGYYLAGRIRKEATDKTDCRNTFFAMMQTFHGMPYLHVVREGESLSRIAGKYCGTQETYPQIMRYDETSGSTVPFENPDLIYPGQKVVLPSVRKYDAAALP